MKKLFAVIALAVSVLSLNAQGTFQFAVTMNGQQQVPPNSTSLDGFGQFTLNGSTFSGGVLVRPSESPVTGVRIHGPAAPGAEANSFYTLATGLWIAPDHITGDPGGQGYDANLIITEAQRAELMAGLWYINVTTEAFPEGEIRGQIILVPEPSTLAIVGGAGLFLLFCTRKNRWFKA